MDKYRIILTGLLLEGVKSEDAAIGLSKLLKLDIKQVQRLFDGKPHPIKRELTKSKAERLQKKLLAIGVMCELESVSANGITIEAVDPPTIFHSPATDEAKTADEVKPVDEVKSSDDGLSLVPMDDSEIVDPGDMTCPKCGHVQKADLLLCDACGIVFEKYQPKDEKDDDSSENIEQTVSQKEDLLGLFIGEKEEVYRRKFIPFEHKQGRFAFSWHWPALFVPFLWAMYRKLWGWAAIIWLVSTFLPFLISMQVLGDVMASFSTGDIPAMGGLWFTNIVSLVLWLLWPFTVSYIYYRYAKKRVSAIAAASEGSVAEHSAIEEGGTSIGGVIIGIVFNIVSFLILTAVMTSQMQQKGEEMMETMQSQVESGDGYVREFANKKASAEEAATMFNLQAISMTVKIWLIQSGIESGEQITKERLVRDAGLDGEIWQDAWGNEIRLNTAYDSYDLQSAGPDGTYGNEDDLLIHKKL